MTIKSCPYCNESERIVLIDHKDFYRVQCSNCEASTGWVTEESEAIDMWNQRTLPTRWKKTSNGSNWQYLLDGKPIATLYQMNQRWYVAAILLPLMDIPPQNDLGIQKDYVETRFNQWWFSG